LPHKAKEAHTGPAFVKRKEADNALKHVNHAHTGISETDVSSKQSLIHNEPALRENTLPKWLFYYRQAIEKRITDRIFYSSERLFIQ